MMAGAAIYLDTASRQCSPAPIGAFAACAESMIGAEERDRTWVGLGSIVELGVEVGPHDAQGFGQTAPESLHRLSSRRPPRPLALDQQMRRLVAHFLPGEQAQIFEHT